MGEVLITWFRDRLGIIVNLNPDEFGLTTRDGTLLAQLLHSYGIIDNAQLNTIGSTEDPALARVNLKHLRVWLKFIGVDCDDDTIEDISNGRGTTAARLFYKIFVSLEGKDKLHFITLQKEREKYIPNSSKFDVTTILERPQTPESLENPLAEQLVKNASIISWHRNKFQTILDRCKLAREQCVAMQMQKTTVKNETNGNIINENHALYKNGVSSVLKQEMQELQNFSDKHDKTRRTDEYTYHELCNERKKGEELEPAPVKLETAKVYMKCMKDRTRSATAIYNCKNRMEKSVTTKLWEKQMHDQETEFDRTIAKKLLTQSQYEKQMMTKLCEIRDQKRRIANNRGIVEKVVQERIGTDYDMELARKHDVGVQARVNIEAECLRLCELHKKIFEEKVLNTQRKHHRICTKVLEDLIDIALEAVSYRENNNNYIPMKIWNEWKALFVKNQPIFSTTENIEYLTNSNSEEEETGESFTEENERQTILNDANFDDYLNVRPPWDEFIPEIDPEIQDILKRGEIVLGYIVHRLLAYIYPFESRSNPVPVPKVSSACILLGILDASVYPIIQALLYHRNIKVLRMEDAINYCLQCYKEEIKDFVYVDLSVMNSPTEVQQKNTTNNAGLQVKKKTTIKKQETSAKPPKSITTTRNVDEQTQTPRAFPDDDMSPDLSNSAYIGKWAYEFLSLGEPISNELNTKILIEYMKSLKNINGWVLIDYPNTFDQMAHLEMALTGQKIPLENEDSSDIDDRTDKSNPIISRVSYETKDADESYALRESRLVCNPIPKDTGQTFISYFTAYIRALPKPKNMHVHETDIYEILPEDSTTLDVFYTDQGIAHAVYYTSFDLFTLKRLCRLVIGDVKIPRVPSYELFGEVLDLLEDKKYEPPSSKAPIIKQLIPHPSTTNADWREESEYESEGGNFGDEILNAVNVGPIPPKPGEDGWEWLNFPQSLILLKALGTLWGNMETIYIEDLKEIFFMKRSHYSNILLYQNRITRHMNEFIQRPDIKQDMLHTFHTQFNDIEKDMRDDLDVKCELHCRVADFREELWELCDERRKETEEERLRIINQDWTAEEIVALANLYIRMIEIEMNRCVDTVQLLQDYYTSMLQRPLAETRLPKYSLRKLELNLASPEASASILVPPKSSKPGAKETASLKDGKTMDHNNPLAASTFDYSQVKNQIADLMIAIDKESAFVTAELIGYQAVRANILYVQNIVESLASSVLENLKKEQTALTPDAKGKIQMPKNQVLPTANDALIVDILKRGPDLYNEWRSAFEFEINRMRLRLKILDNAALSDISSLYKTMEHCFHNILKETNDRYNREIKNVNDMASIFCFAIEEGIPIQEELLLDGDRFVVRSNVLMYLDDLASPAEPTRETILPSQFRMGQLGRLMDIFRYVAPHGSIPERSFVYIIEDMIICGEEEGRINNLPSSWYKLRPSDISQLVRLIFGDSEYVDWREFIIYAMDLPMPNEEEILDARSQFVAMDKNLSEMVTRDQFHSVNLWFSNCAGLQDPACKDLLHEDYQRNEEEMYEDEQEYANNKKIDGLNLPNSLNEFKPSSFGSKKSFTNSAFSLNSRNMTPQETVRLMLAKELLCEMFVSGCDIVNYTAFLLAFSKSYDPREGLGKALSLVLGGKVCISETEGEKFVVELLEQRRHVTKNEAIKIEEQKITEKSDLNLLNNISKNTIEGNATSELDQAYEFKDFDARTIVSQSKQNSSPIENLNLNSSNNSRTSQSNTALLSSPRCPLGSRESGEYNSRKDVSTTTINLTEKYSEEIIIIHWIPLDVCLAVLVASLPWHARQPDILGTSSCLRECLKKVYTDLFDEKINDEQDYVLSHRLINHEFILNLINSTSAFTAKNLVNIVHSLLNNIPDIEQ